MFPCFRVLIILYMNPWKSQVAQATLIHVCMENILHPKKCSLPDTLQALQPPAPSRSTRRGLSGIECRPVQRVQCPGMCVGARSALLPVLCSQSGRAGGWGIHLWGIWGEPGVRWSVARFPKPKKKAFFWIPLANTHPIFTNPNPSDCASLQKFQKLQKDPFWSLDCGIIS